MNSHVDIPSFQATDSNPGATLKTFDEYVAQMKLLFSLVFRKADGSSYSPTDEEKKALMLLKGGRDMKRLFCHVGQVLNTDTFDVVVKKIKDALSERTNKVVQRNMLLTNFPQGSKSFERWTQEICEAANLIDYENYDWRQAAVDAILLQTSNSKLRERALQDNVTFDGLVKLGIAKEQSEKGAALLERASGQSVHGTKIKVEEDVRRLQLENKKLRRAATESRGKKEVMCYRCGRVGCRQGTKCPANGQKCSNCKKMNHFAKACMSKKVTMGKVVDSDSDTSDDSDIVPRIIVGKLDSESISAKVNICGTHSSQASSVHELATDTGVSKTILNFNDWCKVKHGCKLVKTSKRFRPYGTPTLLNILGKSSVKIKAENGAEINTWCFIHKDKKEKSLLGKNDAIRLGIVKLNLKGAKHEVCIDEDAEVLNQISYLSKSDTTTEVSNEQKMIDMKMDKIKSQFPTVFTNATGKFKGDPIKIQVKPGAIPVIQPPRRIPLHYVERTKGEIERMISEDIIEGPIKIEEPGTFLSNLVITDKKNGSNDVRVTLDCQSVNKVIHPSHEPFPLVEELRHQLIGSDRFSTLDMTNCYHQFEIEEEARKLFAFRTPWGIFRYKRMVMGTSPASSEIQRKIRETISHCKNTIHIKDDILVHGFGDKHDQHLLEVLEVLRKAGITCRPSKCHLAQPEVKWFGYIFSKDGMSPDPDKCKIIRDWPAPTTTQEVKSFLQTVQFHAKFLGSELGATSYQELTAPLRAMTKKRARFVWGNKEVTAFDELKQRLCSERVLAPYDTKLKTRLYVDSSPEGTQATLAQEHKINNDKFWRPVNHTSRAWTPAESRYGQIERESNGILTGMFMQRMYTLGTYVEVVNDHKPLVSIYGSKCKPKQLRVDRHRTKLLPFNYNVTYEEGTKTPCDYGSRHPPEAKFTLQQINDWSIEDGDEIHVNRLIEANIPQAITLDKLKQETAKDTVLHELIMTIGRHNRCQAQNVPKAYKDVFPELWTANGILLRGDQIVIPTTLHADIIGLAHEGHQYAEKTLQLLRQTSWFPGMRKSISEYVATCHGCNSALPHNPPVPLEPNLLPERPWQMLHCDFKGPIAGKYYFHVVIDQYSKYPEVDIVTSTSFKKLKPVLDRIFATHGIPEKMSVDGGPPYPSHDMEAYASEMGFELLPVTPDDPQSNGFAENFIKTLCKLIHTSIAEGKDARTELYKFLLQYRSTPHSTTSKSPAEMLFNRKLQTKLPHVFIQTETESQKKTRIDHDSKKMKQKAHFDKRNKARAKNLVAGDHALLKQEKSTTKPLYDPKPYTVKEVNGNRVSLERSDGTRRIRDKNKLKKVQPRPSSLTPSWEHNTKAPVHVGFDIESSINSEVDTADTESSLNPDTLSIHVQQDDSSADYDENCNITPEMEARLSGLLSAARNRSDQEEQVLSNGNQLDDDIESYVRGEDSNHRPMEVERGVETNQDEVETLQDKDDVVGNRCTRSMGVKLRWNTNMNSKNPVVTELGNHKQ